MALQKLTNGALLAKGGKLMNECCCGAACIYQWESIFSCPSGWSNLSLIQKLCAEKNDYPRGWHVDPENPCRYIYTMWGDNCNTADDCEWPITPSKPTGIPSNCCPIYFVGFFGVGSYTTMTLYDWDCCYFGPNVVWEGGFPWPVDGHVVWSINGDCSATVVEATGNYASMIGQTDCIADIHPSGIAADEIISNTKRLKYPKTESCCQGGDSLNYVTLS